MHKLYAVDNLINTIFITDWLLYIKFYSVNRLHTPTLSPLFPELFRDLDTIKIYAVKYIIHERSNLGKNILRCDYSRILPQRNIPEPRTVSPGLRFKVSL